MKPRHFPVGRTGRSTPLLIPSFSSKDPLVARRLYHLGHLLGERVLVSALDLARGYVPLEGILGKKVVFIDSGGYEAQLHVHWANALQVEYKPWTKEEYESILGRLPIGPKYVLTTFDRAPHKAVLEQTKDALAFRERFSAHDVEFLLKPPAPLKFVTADQVAAAAPFLTGFTSLGIAEEELGDSLKSRVQSVLAIRQALEFSGVGLPIHIYGCINPVIVYLYCAAGADMFDGLGWWQHAYDQGRALHIDDWSVAYGDWRVAEPVVNREVDAMNLRMLDQLEASLTRSGGTPNQQDLSKNGFGKMPFGALTEILRDCGVT